MTYRDYLDKQGVPRGPWVIRERDSDGTATAAACEDMPVPKDCQARAEGIAKKPKLRAVT